MRRVILAFNPRSSRAGDIKREVLDRIDSIFTVSRGYEIVLFEVEKASIEENATRLASKVLRAGDLVIVAGGDGTGVAVVQAVMKVEGVSLAMLPYGNFNDIGRSFGCRNLEEIFELEQAGKFSEVWPLEMKIDGEHYRYGLCYFTIGMFAEATEMFEESGVRREIRGPSRRVVSLLHLVKWWMKNRGKRFLPRRFLLNKKVVQKASDIIFVNGKRMAGIMRNRRDYASGQDFLVETGNLTQLWGLFSVMSRSVLWQIPGDSHKKVLVEFEKPEAMEIQGEGEFRRFETVSRIEVRKAGRSIRIVTAK
jgi:diacylglycerol kinase family enzyme